MKFSDAIKKRLTELLEQKKMNVNSLSIKAGINESTIRSILNQSTEFPNILTIRYICIGFGISLQDFFDSELFDESNINDD